MEINPCGCDLWTITDSVFEPVIDDDNTLHHKSIHTNTHKNTQHSPPHHTKHIFLSSTDTGPLHYKWYEACTGTLGHLFLAWCEQVRPTRNGPWPPHSGPQARQGRVQREQSGRAIIVIVNERVIGREEKERDMSRERKRETRDTRRETKMRRERRTSVITVFYRTYCFSN